MTDAAHSDPAAPLSLVLVGGGPRAIMLLERLLAREEVPALQITVVDPHPPGAGRIWREDQSALLKLNSMAQDVTVFTDDSCTIEGPIRPGPTLTEWAELVRDGALPDVLIDDDGVVAELEALRGESFPTRRLQSHYLEWFWRTTVAAAPPHVTVQWLPGRVDSVQVRGAGYGILLDDGAELSADLVVYALGHNGREPDADTAATIAAAAREGVYYVPPAFTADAELSALDPGQNVIVRGMGLAAVDLVVLLAEGRGGCFTRADDGSLRYEPSGREPRLHLGSRRGVPYRSKVSSTLQGAPPELHVLTKETVGALVARPGPVDFERDVWPLIAQELTWAHYRELFTGHPDRVTVTWEQFQETLRRVAGDTQALRRAADAVIPDPLDRFDVPSLERPLGDETFTSREQVQRRIRQHIVDDLTLRTTQERSSAQALFLAILFSFVALADVPPEKWSARSRAVSLPVTWHTFFSYVASGPPAHRLEELLALADAGVVQFLGPDVEVRIEPGRGVVASSPRVPGEVVGTALVDAWLPGSGAAVSDNAALRDLAAVHGRELTVADDSFAGSLGRVEVDAEGRVIAPDGKPQERLFALGSFTSLTEAGAFTRPRANSLPLRQTDHIAGAISESLSAIAADASDLRGQELLMR